MKSLDVLKTLPCFSGLQCFPQECVEFFYLTGALLSAGQEALNVAPTLTVATPKPAEKLQLFTKTFHWSCQQSNETSLPRSEIVPQM